MNYRFVVRLYKFGGNMNKTQSILTLFLAAIVWGFAFVAQRVGGENVGAFTFSAIRFFIGATSLIPVISIFEKEELNKDVKNTRFPGFICGILLFIAVVFQHYGIIMTDFAGKSGFITDFYIILVPIFGIFLHKKTPIQAWIGAVIALVGFYFLCMNGGSFTINMGDVLIFISAIFFALHISVVDTYADRIYPLRLSCYQFYTVSFFAFIGVFFFETIDFNAIKEAAIPILYGGLMSVGVGYTLQIVGQKNCDGTTSAIILSSEAVFCAIGSMLILKEMMSFNGYFGCILVFVGIILAQIPVKKK